jgi:hypothetical protein
MHIFDKEEIAKTGYPDGTAYSSHRPYLEYIVDFLYEKNGGKKLNILECGTGHGSSAFFSEITKAEKAKVWGIEYHNVGPDCWFDTMKKEYSNDNYNITLEAQGLFVFGTPYFEKLDDHYDIIFVDTSAYENRANWVKFSGSGRAKVVVLHDSEHMHRFKPWLLDFVNDEYDYVYDSWPIQNPGTLFASNIDLKCNLNYEGRKDDMPHKEDHEEIEPTQFGFPIQKHV